VVVDKTTRIIVTGAKTCQEIRAAGDRNSGLECGARGRRGADLDLLVQNKVEKARCD